ncbi:hypothetical protein [Streptomyces calvus]
MSRNKAALLARLATHALAKRWAINSGLTARQATALAWAAGAIASAAVMRI